MEKIQNFNVSWEKKKFKDSYGMFKQIFLAQDSYHKHLRY
jgi:hypothetical protein